MFILCVCRQLRDTWSVNPRLRNMFLCPRHGWTEAKRPEYLDVETYAGEKVRIKLWT